MRTFVTTLTAAILVATSAAATPDPNQGLKEMVKEKLADAHATALLPVVQCESGFRQYDERGRLLRNPTINDVVGIMQVREKYHPDPAVLYAYNERYGTDHAPEDFNLRDPQENVDYGIVLYKVKGLKPWTECLS